MTGLLRAEFLKLRKRWMPYVLFLLMLAGAAFVVWAIGYSTWHDNDQEFAASGLRTFAYPYSVPALLDSGQFWGSAFFVAITHHVHSGHGAQLGNDTPRPIRGRLAGPLSHHEAIDAHARFDGSTAARARLRRAALPLGD